MRRRYHIWRMKRTVLEAARWVREAPDEPCDCELKTVRAHMVEGLINAVKRLEMLERGEISHPDQA